MAFDPVDLAVKAGPVLAGAAVSLFGAVFTIGRKLGKVERSRQAEATANSGEHRILSHRVTDADKKAEAAHKRLDEHDRMLARLEERGANTLVRMEQLGERMERLAGRIDELLMRLPGKGGGNA